MSYIPFGLHEPTYFESSNLSNKETGMLKDSKTLPVKYVLVKMLAWQCTPFRNTNWRYLFKESGHMSCDAVALCISESLQSTNEDKISSFYKTIK